MKFSTTLYKLILAALLLLVRVLRETFVVANRLSLDDLIVDLGSSNTWVGAGTRYVETSTSFNTGEPVALSYGAGAASFSGVT